MLTKGLTIAAAVVIGLLLAGGAYYWQTGHCPFGCDGGAPAAPANGGSCGEGGCGTDSPTCAGAACTGDSACCEGGKAVEGKAAATTNGKPKCCAATACFDPNAPIDTKTT